MIRIRKPVRLMEWGEGTNTTNQVWTVVGEGNIVKYGRAEGVTTLVISTNGFSKKNTKDNSLKLAQQGEGMTGNSKYWGEVAMGVLKKVEDGGRTVVVEISAATKLDTRRTVPKWEEEGWQRV
jgi:hypothetical protein